MTLVNVDATIDAGEAAPAQALEAVIHVEATAAISAGLRQAEVDALLANGARIAGRAFALILINAIDATAAVLARIAMTIVNVFLAIGAFEAARTVTLVLVAANRRALARIHARIRIAVLHLHLAVSTTEAGRAFALEALTRVATTAAVLARLTRTRHRLRFAMSTNPTVATLACVAVVVEAVIVGACAVVQAGIDGAVFNFNFAVGAEKAGWTFACVRALTSVGAGSAVVTWLVIGAEV